MDNSELAGMCVPDRRDVLTVAINPCGGARMMIGWGAAPPCSREKSHRPVARSLIVTQ